MLIDWFKLIAALALLLTPIHLFHRKQVRFRALSRDWDGYWRRTIFLSTTLIDFLRTFLGVWLLSAAVTRAPQAAGLARHGPLLITGAVLAGAAASQTLAWRQRDAVLAPFAFTMAVTLAHLPPMVGIFAVAIPLVVASGARIASAFFPVLALSILATGFLFTQKRLLLTLVITAASVALPWLLSLLSRRHFVVPYAARPHRNARTGSDSQPPM